MPSIADVRRYDEEHRPRRSWAPPTLGEHDAWKGDTRLALERARFPWQWGPPYTFAGNPPLAQEVATAYPGLKREAVSEFRTIPVSLWPGPSPDYGGLYYPEQHRMGIGPYSQASVGLHEYLHAYDFARDQEPSYALWDAYLRDPHVKRWAERVYPPWHPYSSNTTPAEIWAGGAEVLMNPNPWVQENVWPQVRSLYSGVIDWDHPSMVSLRNTPSPIAAWDPFIADYWNRGLMLGRQRPSPYRWDDY
jgi:hypothetical protein